MLASIEERHPGWSPLQLLAEIANDKKVDLAIRLDAAKCLAGFLHPKPKPAEFDPEQAIDFEKRLAEAVTEVKLAAAARAAERNPGLFGLGERLSRAMTRIDAALDHEPSEIVEDEGQEDEEPEPEPRQATPAPPTPPTQTPEPTPYRPMLPSRPQRTEIFNPHDSL